jgi:hypothetical protein
VWRHRGQRVNVAAVRVPFATAAVQSSEAETPWLEPELRPFAVVERF